MKMIGSRVIPAPRAVVWKGLNDPAVLQKCIPGCDRIEAATPTNLKVTVVAKVGPVKASFAGEVNLVDVKAPVSYRIEGKGQGGLAGFASGGASVTLTEIAAGETRMDYDVDAQIGGKLAMLGARLIDSAAQSLAGQFFARFADLMKAAHAPSESRAVKPKAAKTLAKKSGSKAAVKKALTRKVGPKKKAKRR